MSGIINLKSLFNKGITLDQQYQNSGNPWSKIKGSPDPIIIV